MKIDLFFLVTVNDKPGHRISIPIKRIPLLLKTDIRGYPLPKFIWYKNGRAIDPASKEYSIAPSGSLGIANVIGHNSLDGTATYTLKVEQGGRLYDPNINVEVQSDELGKNLLFLLFCVAFFVFYLLYPSIVIPVAFLFRSLRPRVSLKIRSSFPHSVLCFPFWLLFLSASFFLLCFLPSTFSFPFVLFLFLFLFHSFIHFFFLSFFL